MSASVAGPPRCIHTLDSRERVHGGNWRRAFATNVRDSREVGEYEIVLRKECDGMQSLQATKLISADRRSRTLPMAHGTFKNVPSDSLQRCIWFNDRIAIKSTDNTFHCRMNLPVTPTVRRTQIYRCSGAALRYKRDQIGVGTYA